MEKDKTRMQTDPEALEKEAAESAEEAANAEAAAPEEAAEEGAEQEAAGADAAEAGEEAEAGKEAEAGDEAKEPEEQPEEEADKKPAKPDRKDQQIAELGDKYKRLFAEFDNYRKRTDAEKVTMFNEGEKAVLLKILPLIDNFERALSSVPEEEKDSSFVQGVDKVYRSFMDQLGELGVKAIEAAGQPFDANFHNAVMHVEDEAFPESTVTEEFQKGYMFRDRVLRYSMVKVAN